jgi:iron complex outermembrane receptor protein
VSQGGFFPFLFDSFVNLRAAICACLCLLPASGAYAQQACTGVLRGEILERHNHEPVYPALIRINGLGKGAETDTLGGFRIDGICPGTYRYSIESLGFAPDSGTLVLGTRDTLFHLHADHDARQLRGVTVSEERARTPMQSRESLDRMAILAQSGKTLTDILKTVNGVNSFNNGATIAKPVIHGLHSNRILMLNNGIRQEDQQWGGEHAPDIDPFLAGKLTVIKGAAGVRYGTDALAGVILVEPSALRKAAGWDGEINLNAFSNNRMGVASGMVEHGFKRVPGLTVRLQGSLKYGGNYRVPGYWVANSGVRETNYSGTIGWTGHHTTAELFYSHFDSEIGIYTGSHTGSREDLLAAINSDRPLVPAAFSYDISRPKQHVVHDLVKLKLSRDSRVGLWSLVYGYQHNFRQEYDVLRASSDLAQLNLTLNTQTLNLNLDLHQHGAFTTQVGLDGIYQQNFIRDGDRPFIPNYNGYGAAAYAIERWKGGGWNLEAGLRYDQRIYDMYNADGPAGQVSYYYYDFGSLSGTLGVQRKPADWWNWGATFSSAWRAPQAAELFSAGFHQGAARVEYGDKALVPEQSFGLNIDNTFLLTPKTKLELGLYSQYIRNFIYLEPGADLLTIRGYYKTFSYTQANAWLNGADLTATQDWGGGFSNILRGSFLLARNTRQNDWLIQMPADRISLSTRYEKNLQGAIRGLHAEVTGKYVFRQYRIPANFDSLDYPRPPAGYFLLNAEAGLSLMAGKQALDISLAVANALNTRYREYLDAFRYFLDQPGTDIALRIRIPLGATGN